MNKTFLKNQIAVEIYKSFVELGISQTEFSKLMNIKQPKVSRIFNGHLKEFSLETLIEYLQLLGNYVEIKITKIDKKLKSTNESQIST